jgi:hypothetical protein
MTTLNIVHRRLHNQHLTRPDFETPGDIVRWFGAVQAQDLMASLYAIGLRMPEATEALVEQAIADKQVVRTWPMRGTIHFVPPEDARWMLNLLAHRQTVKFASIYRRAGLTGEMFAKAKDVLIAALQGGKVVMRKELYRLMAEAGIDVGGDLRGAHLLGYWSHEGLICLGPRHGKQQTFTLLDEWVPQPRTLEGEEALAAVAKRYFTSHGPATLYDFVWWTGLTVSEARLAMQLVEHDFEQAPVDGREYWFTADTQPESASAQSAYLLPAYDEFTVAYRDRSAFLDPAFFEVALHGIGYSVIIDGRMVGTWKRTLSRNDVRISVSAFAPLSQEQRDAVEVAAERYGRFIGLPSVVDVDR